MTKYVVQRRRHLEVNNDPQRRCYNGCHFSTEVIQTEWEDMNYTDDKAKAEWWLNYWRDLNAYAVSQRGRSALCEFKIVEGDDNGQSI